MLIIIAGVIILNETLVVIVRGVIAFTTLLIFGRILGKQQISQLSFFDYILGITIGSTASTLTTDLTSRAWYHFVGLLTWIVAVLLLQIVTMKWRYASKYIDGEPTLVVMDGKIMEDAMKRIRYTVDDLMEQLREKNIFKIMEIQYAILEKNGELTILKKPEFENVTIKDMNLPIEKRGIDTELIYDGIVIDKNLRQMNHDMNWLNNELQKQGIGSPSEVFYMCLNPDGTLYTDKYRDHVQDGNKAEINDYKGPY